MLLLVSIYEGVPDLATAYILKTKRFAEPPFSQKNLRKKCVNPGVNVSQQMRLNLAFKILRQKVRKSPRQYFATKVCKLRFQILKTEHTVRDQ